jgi:PAS domain S-box-containing protein
MDDEHSKTLEILKIHLEQQTAIAALGQRALIGGDLSALINEAVTLIVRNLAVEFCEVLEMLPDGTALLLRAGVGWKKGSVGNTKVGVGTNSQAGYSLLSNEAVIAEDLGAETRFSGSALLREHGVVSGVSIVIAGKNRPFGVIGAHTAKRRSFTKEDIHFIQSIANVLAPAIERKRGEEALRESEKRYKDLAELLPQVVFETDDKANLTFTNRRAFELFGYTQEDFEAGLNVLNMLAPEDRSRGAKNIQMVLAGEKPQNPEYRVLRKDGSALHVIIDSSAIVRDSEPVGIRGILVDITERKHMEEELRKLSHAVEQSPASVVITDKTGLIEYVNHKFTELTGYTLNEALGKNPRILKSGQMPQETYEELWSTITSGREWKGQLHNKKKNGELYWEHASISPIIDSTGQISHFIGIKEDITERKRLEQQFFQAQKMEAIGRLAGGVAHDFNNLLSVIIGSSDLLLDTLDQSDPKRVELEEIKDAGNRAATLTSQLLAFSRKQIRTPEFMDINEVLTDVEKMLHRLIGEDVEVVLRLSPEIGQIYADPVQLEQVIMNLAVNARDAMPQGGKFILETADVTLDEEYARDHIAIKPGRYTMLAVSDTGCGMTPEIQAHLFEPFFTTKERGKGTGLGLSTVYGIVKQNDGFIWVYSEPNQGTTFKIYLPTIDRPVVSETPPIKEVANLHGTETILVVEDDPHLRALASRILQRHGYAVLEAQHAASAELICGQHQGPIHLLLTDIVMPGASGRQLAHLLANSRPEMKVIYTSGYANDVIAQRWNLEPGITLIQKPFTPDLLAHKVREVLGTEASAENFYRRK